MRAWLAVTLAVERLAPFEFAVFALSCVAIAASPAVAHLAIRALDATVPSRWFDGGVYVSWAFLISFSWACLPSRELPLPARLKAWGLFFVLELAYPIASWLLEGGSGLHAFVDVTSAFSTSVALAAGTALVLKGGGDVRAGDWGIVLPLAFVAFFIVLPGVSGEWDWWSAVELPAGDTLSQVLRVTGVVSGTAGVFRNLWRSSLFS